MLFIRLKTPKTERICGFDATVHLWRVETKRNNRFTAPAYLRLLDYWNAYKHSNDWFVIVYLFEITNACLFQIINKMLIWSLTLKATEENNIYIYVRVCPRKSKRKI